MSIINRLDNWIKANGYTFKEAADVLSIPPNSIRVWIRRINVPSRDNIKKIKKALGEEDTAQRNKYVAIDR